MPDPIEALILGQPAAQRTVSPVDFPRETPQQRADAMLRRAKILQSEMSDLEKALADARKNNRTADIASIERDIGILKQDIAKSTSGPSVSATDPIEALIAGAPMTTATGEQRLPRLPREPSLKARADEGESFIGGIAKRVIQPGLQHYYELAKEAGEKIVGAGEAATALATGGPATLGAAYGGVGAALLSPFTKQTPAEVEATTKKILSTIGYQPKTERGQEYVQQLGQFFEAAKLPPVMTPEMMALQAAQVGTGTQAANIARRATAPDVTVEPPRVLPTQPNLASTEVPAVLRRQLEARQAAAAAAQPTAPAVAPATAAVEPAVGRVSAGAAAVPQEDLRIARARSLPVPIDLSQDQATRAPADVRFARETAKDPILGQALQEKYASDNAKIQQNLDVLSEQTGAQMIGLPPAELGQQLLKVFEPYKETRKSQIKPAYDAARAAGEMSEPINIKALNDFVTKNASAEKNAPVLSSIRAEIKRLAGKGTEIPLNDLEEMRKMIGVLSEDSKSNAHFGKEAKKIIDRLTENKGGELYKIARKLNADYMTEFENTPVIRNLTSMKPGTTQRSVAIEDLVEKSLLRGPTSDVRDLFATLQKVGPEGQAIINELRGYVANKIKDEATKGVTLDINGKPYVSTKGLDSQIKNLDKSGKLELLFGKEGAEHYRTLNDVTKDIQTVPQGTTNPSGTASTLAAMVEMGAQTALTGVPVPVVMVAKHLYGKQQTKKKLNKVQQFIDYGKK